MHRHLFIIVLMSTISATFWSCEQNVTVDLEEYDQKVVVHSLITKDSLPRIVLTKSASYFSGNEEDNEYKTLKNASVIISNNGQDDTLDQRTTNKPFNPYNTGQYSDNQGQSDSSNVAFHYFQGDQEVMAGRTYQLKIIHNGTTVLGETTVPQSVSIDSASYEKNVVEQLGFTDTGRTIKAYVDDHGGTDNAYRLHVTFLANVPSGNLELDELASTSVTFDDAQDGEQFAVEMDLPSIQADEFSNNFPDTAIAEVRVEHITRETGEYLRSLNEQSSSSNSPFSEPVLIKSNVDNGLGVFGSYSLSEAITIQVPLRN